MNQDKFERDMARLEEARRHTQERLRKQQERLDQRFELMQARLERRLGKPSVSQQKIIEAALDLLAEDGLANLSLRKVAAKLDMQAPALYWHFKNKEVLVDYMAEAILKKEFKTIEVRRDDQSWQDWLRQHMAQLRRAMLSYPDGARVVAGAHIYPAVTLARSLECGLISLTGAGLSLKEARQIMITAANYTFGYVIEEQASPSVEELKNFDLSAFLAPYPHMAKAISQIEQGEHARDNDYLAGLNYIIAGASPH